MAGYYAEAASALEALLEREAGAKSAALGRERVWKKQTYALTVETLKWAPVLDKVLSATGVLSNSKRPSLLFVLAYELLFGKGVVKGGGALKKALLGAKNPTLKEALDAYCASKGVSEPSQLLPDILANPPVIPRYAFSNPLIASDEDLVARLAEEGWRVEDAPGKGTIEELRAGAIEGVVFRDVHVPGLFVFPSGTDLHAHELVSSKALILLDKASAFPPAVLRAPGIEGWHVADVCAAPGNKTLGAAIAVGESGKVSAWDRDTRRASQLTKNMSAAGASSRVKVTAADVLQARASQVATVRGVIVDPSCSGSGMMDRWDEATKAARKTAIGKGLKKSGASKESESSRLASLAQFQERVLNKALGWPRTERVVYSTCSIHVEENEAVVARVLDENAKRGWTLDPALPGWPIRGWVAGGLDESQAQAVVRSDPVSGGTNGFFVACFKRETPTVVVTADDPEPQAVTSKKRKRAQDNNKEDKAVTEGESSSLTSGSRTTTTTDVSQGVKLAPATLQRSKKKRKKGGYKAPIATRQ